MPPLTELPALLAIAAVACCGLCALARAGDGPLVDFRTVVDPATVKPEGATAEIRETDGAKVLHVSGPTGVALPGVVIRAPGGAWDLARSDALAIDVTNTGKSTLTICCRAHGPGWDDETLKPWGGRGAETISGLDTGSVVLAPGRSGTLRVDLLRRAPGTEKIELFGVRGSPAALRPETSASEGKVARVFLFADRPEAPFAFDVVAVRAVGTYDAGRAALSGKTFFPFIDEFGQYIHADWPDKLHDAGELARRGAAEQKDLGEHRGPDGWDRYGGWAAGPKLEATGYFRAEKHEGKWWLVDPQGRLFFSHGIDCVGMGDTTPLDDRAAWFRNLPARDGEFAECFGRFTHCIRDYYKGRQGTTFDFSHANLIRKHGDAWATASANLSHRRLRSWGLNTIGTWSTPKVYLLRRTPYVVIVHTGSRPIAGSSGYWRQFSDVFDESFRANLDRRMAAQRGKVAGDPWCIGFFVDNELSWGKETTLAEAALMSPPDQPAKKAFVEDLKARYGEIGRLNARWGTSHASWQALLAATAAPDAEDAKRARDDLLAFNERIVEQYFRVCRDAVRKHAPGQLYMGCRFAWSNPRVIQLASKFCDVVSFNLYRWDVTDFRLPDGVDKPVISGEFHFGALDRGMFHTGLLAVADQPARAVAYDAYLRSALAHPNVVGVHWFKYRDESAVGRAQDGENYQIGFLDVTDTPYRETVDAARRIASQMYTLRAGR